MHMLQVLPPFSHRQRSGVEYFDVVPRPLIRGIDPHKPHTLMPLGRADVRVGPMVYYGVRFWELRASIPPVYPKPRPPSTAPPHGLVQYPASVRPPPGEAGYIRSSEGYVRPMSNMYGSPGTPTRPNPTNGVAVVRPGHSSTSENPPATSSPNSTAPRAPASVTNTPGTAPNTSHVAPNTQQLQPAGVGREPVTPSSGPQGSSPAPSTPASAQSNSHASNHLSTSGSRSHHVSGGTSETHQSPQTPSRPVQTPGNHVSPSPSTNRPSPSNIPPRPSPRPLDAGFLSRLQQRAEHDKHLQNLLQLARTGQLPESALPQLNSIIASLMVPPTSKPEEHGPPVVLVEFPENPSINFVLPLWHMAVERRRHPGARRGHSALLSFFLPAIGSKAAGESGLGEAESVERGILLDPSLRPKNEEEQPSEKPPESQIPPADSHASSSGAQTNGNMDETADTKRNSRTKRARPKKETITPTPQRGHELFPTTWYLRSDMGIDERLWDCLGRIPACVTSEPGRDRIFASEGDRDLFGKLQRSFSARYNTMPPTNSLPRNVAISDIPQGLEDHVSDRYAMRIQSSTSRPQPKRKVATLSNSKEPRPPRMDFGLLRAHAAEFSDGEPRPKRKRHVATHNPDGSIKSCGACGKTKTPMWRRGPKGPSQLCNACGAKWKAGRLVVPDVPPPPILDDTLPVRRVAVSTSQAAAESS